MLMFSICVDAESAYLIACCYLHLKMFLNSLGNSKDLFRCFFKLSYLRYENVQKRINSMYEKCISVMTSEFCLWFPHCGMNKYKCQNSNFKLRNPITTLSSEFREYNTCSFLYAKINNYTDISLF